MGMPTLVAPQADLGSIQQFCEQVKAILEGHGLPGATSSISAAVKATQANSPIQVPLVIPYTHDETSLTNVRGTTLELNYVTSPTITIIALGLDGQRILVRNIGAGRPVLQHGGTGNIVLMAGANYTFSATVGDSVLLQFRAQDGKWYEVLGALLPSAKVPWATPGTLGSTTPNTVDATTLTLHTTSPNPPVANRLYKALTGAGYDVPMDPTAALASLQPVLTVAGGGIAAGAEEGWHVVGAASEPAFKVGATTWSAIGGRSCRFRKYVTGQVEVQINASTTGAADSSAAWTMPGGYKPGLVVGSACFDLSSGLVSSEAAVLANGNVLPNAGAAAPTAWVGIITYFAEA